MRYFVIFMLIFPQAYGWEQMFVFDDRFFIDESSIRKISDSVVRLRLYSNLTMDNPPIPEMKENSIETYREIDCKDQSFRELRKIHYIGHDLKEYAAEPPIDNEKKHYPLPDSIGMLIMQRGCIEIRYGY